MKKQTVDTPIKGSWAFSQNTIPKTEVSPIFQQADILMRCQRRMNEIQYASNPSEKAKQIYNEESAK